MLLVKERHELYVLKLIAISRYWICLLQTSKYMTSLYTYMTCTKHNRWPKRHLSLCLQDLNEALSQVRDTHAPLPALHTRPKTHTYSMVTDQRQAHISISAFNICTKQSYRPETHAHHDLCLQRLYNYLVYNLVILCCVTSLPIQGCHTP